MWRLEKDPHLSSTFGTVMLLDRAPDFDSFRRRMERTALAIPRLRQRVLPVGRQPVATDVGRRPRLRHRPARAAHRLPQAGHAAPGARPRLADRRRPVRPHAAVVAVRRRRRHARRQGGGDPEDAPHDHRRRAWGRALAAVPRLRARRAGAAADRPRRPTERAEAPAAVDRPTRSGSSSPGRLRIPIGIAKQVRELLADPAAIPDASNAASQDDARHRSASSPTPRAPARRCGPDARCSAASSRRAPRSGPPRTPPSGSAARSTRRSSPPPPTPPRRTTSRWARRSSRCERRWRSPPAPTPPAATPSRWRDCSCRPARCRSPSASSPSTKRPRLLASRSKDAGLDTLAAITTALPTSLITRLARQQAQHGRLRHVEREGLAGARVRGRRPAARDLPDRAARRRRLQPDADVVPGQPRHGAQHRHRGGRVDPELLADVPRPLVQAVAERRQTITPDRTSVPPQPSGVALHGFIARSSCSAERRGLQ